MHYTDFLLNMYHYKYVVNCLVIGITFHSLGCSQWNDVASLQIIALFLRFDNMVLA